MSNTLTVTVPDIGDFSDVPVIEVLVAVGDRVGAEDALVTLESDKATMDVPSPAAGVVREIKVAVGDTVSEGAVLALLEADGEADAPADDAPGAPAAEAAPSEPAPRPPPNPPPDRAPEQSPAPEPRAAGGTPPGRRSPTADLPAAPDAQRTRSHATPTIRRFARELGVELEKVRGTGRKGRITRDDVMRFVKGELSRPPAPAGASTGAGIPPIPAIDFSRFGEVEERPLSRIKRISGAHLQRAWLNVPHVTHHDLADVTELEAFRRSLKREAEAAGVRLTPLAFIMKALVAALVEFPHFNASLSEDGQNLILKHYFNIGVAVDTPNGLVVPVIREVDTKGVYALAGELASVSARARDGKLTPGDMQGGCMSISSLGGIGGVGFTPIVNAPELAILGVSRSTMSPVWNGESFEPRLMLPLDLSYDHRVIDGAEAARFVAFLARALGDVRRLLL